jgi:hypothetical protein
MASLVQQITLVLQSCPVDQQRAAVDVDARNGVGSSISPQRTVKPIVSRKRTICVMTGPSHTLRTVALCGARRLGGSTFRTNPPLSNRRAWGPQFGTCATSPRMTRNHTVVLMSPWRLRARPAGVP